MMELLPRTIIFPLIVLVIYCFWVCIAADCGGVNVSRAIIVDKSGKENFTTIQAAIDSVPQHNKQWVKIHINPGTYQEQVQIPYDKPCILLEGSGRNLTIITYSAHQQTDTSATFASFPDNVIVKGITFKNSFNVPSNNVMPALAARVYGNKSAFYSCRFVGLQDTLWSVQGLQYYKDCVIEGAVDFIFGRGQSYFEDCVLNVTSSGFITAQGRNSENDPSGFVFRRGYVVGNGGISSFLGRAYGPYSRVIFYGTNLGSVVTPAGWDAWSYSKQQGRLTNIEIECGGAGANTSKRVPWTKTSMSASELSKFSISSFIDQDGWLANIPQSVLEKFRRGCCILGITPWADKSMRQCCHMSKSTKHRKLLQ